MTIEEKQMDVLEVAQGWAIAHCVSADMALGAGVAKQINDRFNMSAQLRNTFCRQKPDLNVGTSYLVMNVFNMVTKEKYWHKPTLETMRQALESMANTCTMCGIKKLAMPRIGCGLDRMNWDDVKPLIEKAFDGMDIRITVCYL